MDEGDSSLTRGILGMLVLVLVISAGFKVFEDLQTNPTACQPSDPTNLDLAPLILLSLSISPSSSPSQDLRNSTFLSMVGTSYGETIATLVPQTVLGYIQGSEMWKNWTGHYMADPPSWIDVGPMFVLNQDFRTLQDEALNSTGSSTALGYITGLAASVSGYTLEALDFVTFNGLTSLKALFETGSTEQALSASFPGQLAQLYHEAFDPGVPSATRAQYLGSALAITTVMALLGGLSGFSDKFQIALADSGLGDAWDTMKPSFEKLGAISPEAANLALVVLQKLALKFPSDISSVAGFTSNRIDAMAEVLYDAGDSTADIDQKIGGLIQAADSAVSPDDVATGADVISYDDGGGIQVKFDDQNRMYEYTEASTIRVLPAKLVEEILPGFESGKIIPVAIRYQQLDVTVYYYYSGGTLFQPTAPSDLVKPGDEFTVSFAILTRNAFVQSLPEIDFTDPVGINWVADRSQLTSYSIQGDEVSLSFVQQPSQVEGGGFTVIGTASASLGHGSVSGFYLDVKITDLFDNDRTLRIYYQGYGQALIAISMGSEFVPIDLFSFDGVRQVIVYEKVGPTGDFHEAVFYPLDPSGLYSLGEMNPYTVPYPVGAYSQGFFINDVATIRSMEYEMGTQGSTADVARIGAEVAYAVAVEKLGLHDVVMIDPSQPGPDLYTRDGTVVIEARMLQRTANAVGDDLNIDLKKQLIQMVKAINSDFKGDPSAEKGYVVLTYVDNQKAIHTIVLEVLR